MPFIGSPESRLYSDSFILKMRVHSRKLVMQNRERCVLLVFVKCLQIVVMKGIMSSKVS